MLDKEKIREIYAQVADRIKNVHIGCFEGMDKPMFLISDTYPGVWLEHVYDAVFYAKLEPSAIDVAKNTINYFMDYQTPEGQLPFVLINPAKSGRERSSIAGYSQIQECVSFPELCLEVCEMSGDRALLERSYKSAAAWVSWLRKYRMTTERGLIELFVGYDTGHDNSGRLAGLSCPGLYQKDGVRMNAGCLPENDAVAPIFAVDMNCNFYASNRALEKMANLLGKSEEAAKWASDAAEIKKKLFEHCYDEANAFFYDVDKNGNKRKYLSSTIFHLFLEKVLDKNADAELIEKIYTRHIKNPDEFWTPYPFPSMAVCDPSCKDHKPNNCWGYYTQGLIALRCTRWMDFYGMEKDFDVLCEKWLEAWTNCFDELKMGQELDPFSGKPTECSQWYSSCMLFYTYAARRLNLI